MNIAKILPMAFVMIAGPQILTAIFLATTEGWRRNSAAYLAGAALSITAIVTIAYFVGSGAREAGALGRHARHCGARAARRRGGLQVPHA